MSQKIQFMIIGKIYLLSFNKCFTSGKNYGIGTLAQLEDVSLSLFTVNKLVTDKTHNIFI